MKRSILMRNILFLLLFVGLFSQCKNTEKLVIPEKKASYRFAFYNVENLFDLENDPEKLDDDFTPTGRNKWTKDRYDKKLQDLARVIKAMDTPALLGLCEVENEQVLKDLVLVESIQSGRYGFVHYDSPDMRGIDVALLYNKEKFRVLQSDFIRIDFPVEEFGEYTSRDILNVKGVLMGRDTLHIFVNHWPSRRGGTLASQPRRLQVARKLRQAVDELFASNPQAAIIIMGDMNDEPIHDSLIKGLKTQRENEQADLYNCFMKADRAKEGSYNYRGNWNLLDQIIVSSPLHEAGHSLQVKKAVIFREDWMMFNDRKYGPSPSRTFGGPNYYGGFSDHLPVYIEISVN